MRVWRVTRRIFAAFDGQGAFRAGGRWHSKGVAIVYTASSASLATLEYLVHVHRDQAPRDLVLIPAEVPERLIEVYVTPLPADWQQLPPPRELKAIGDEWARAQRSVALVLPSAVVPDEMNVLLNPAHPDFNAVQVAAPREWPLDPRLRGR